MAYRATAATRASAQAKRTSMLDAARALVAASGFSGATVAAIAADSGVSVGSVYSYFDNREALLAEIFRDAAEYEFAQVQRAVDAAGDDPAVRMAAFIDTFADRALRGRRLAWSLIFEPVTPAVEVERLRLRAGYRGLGEQIIGDGVAAGLFAAQDVPVVAGAVMGAVAESLVGALTPGLDPDVPLTEAASAADRRALVATITTFCFRALGAGPAPKPTPTE